MNTNMNSNFQQDPKAPHINYDAVDKLRMQQVQQTIDSNKFGKSKPRKSGKNDWMTLAVALGIVVVIVLILIFSAAA